MLGDHKTALTIGLSRSKILSASTVSAIMKSESNPTQVISLALVYQLPYTDHSTISLWMPNRNWS